MKLFEEYIDEVRKQHTETSVGVCNKCRWIIMVDTGNGVDEPIDPVPMCSKKNIEVTPVPIRSCRKYCPHKKRMK